MRAANGNVGGAGDGDQRAQRTRERLEVSGTVSALSPVVIELPVPGNDVPQLGIRAALTCTRGVASLSASQSSDFPDPSTAAWRTGQVARPILHLWPTDSEFSAGMVFLKIHTDGLASFRLVVDLLAPDFYRTAVGTARSALLDRLASLQRAGVAEDAAAVRPARPGQFRSYTARARPATARRQAVTARHAAQRPRGGAATARRATTPRVRSHGGRRPGPTPSRPVPRPRPSTAPEASADAQIRSRKSRIAARSEAFRRQRHLLNLAAQLRAVKRWSFLLLARRAAADASAGGQASGAGWQDSLRGALEQQAMAPTDTAHRAEGSVGAATAPPWAARWFLRLTSGEASGVVLGPPRWPKALLRAARRSSRLRALVEPHAVQPTPSRGAPTGDASSRRVDSPYSNGTGSTTPTTGTTRRRQHSPTLSPRNASPALQRPATSAGAASRHPSAALADTASSMFSPEDGRGGGSASPRGDSYPPVPKLQLPGHAAPSHPRTRLVASRPGHTPPAPAREGRRPATSHSATDTARRVGGSHPRRPLRGDSLIDMPVPHLQRLASGEEGSARAEEAEAALKRRYRRQGALLRARQRSMGVEMDADDEGDEDGDEEGMVAAQSEDRGGEEPKPMVSPTVRAKQVWTSLRNVLISVSPSRGGGANTAGTPSRPGRAVVHPLRLRLVRIARRRGSRPGTARQQSPSSPGPTAVRRSPSPRPAGLSGEEWGYALRIDVPRGDVKSCGDLSLPVRGGGDGEGMIRAAHLATAPDTASAARPAERRGASRAGEPRERGPSETGRDTPAKRPRPPPASPLQATPARRLVPSSPPSSPRRTARVERTTAGEDGRHPSPTHAAFPGADTSLRGTRRVRAMRPASHSGAKQRGGATSPTACECRIRVVATPLRRRPEGNSPEGAEHDGFSAAWASERAQQVRAMPAPPPHPPPHSARDSEYKSTGASPWPWSRGCGRRRGRRGSGTTLLWRRRTRGSRRRMHCAPSLRVRP